MKYLYLFIIIGFVHHSFSQSSTYNPTQILVKFKDSTFYENIDYSKVKLKNKKLTPIEASFSTHKVKEVKKSFQKIASKRLNRIYTLTLEDSVKRNSLIDALQKLPEVEKVEKIPLYETFFTPNDIHPNQWNLPKIQAENAWDLSRGSTSVVVAIVDDAVLTSHEDLQANIWQNSGEIAGNSIDDDNNGYVDDVIGYDVADNDNNPNPPATATNSVFSHGTHCAGIAAAVSNNTKGIASIGYSVKIMAIKTKRSSTTDNFLHSTFQGIVYAILSGADIISMSFGGYGYSSIYQELLDEAHDRGIVLVAAAGNNNTTTPMYPASYNHVISVGSTDNNDIKSSFSNYGSTIDIMAPGSDIWSTLAGSVSSYGYLSGTSMACPLVAGVCALMKSYSPNATPSLIEACLKSGADNINAANASYLGQIGAGRLNAFRSVACLNSAPIADFSASITSACVGQIINFTDKTLGGTPNQWNWTFTGGSPTFSSNQNPMASYSAPGVYSVYLRVQNSQGTDWEIKNNYITVNTPSATISGNTTINNGQSTQLRVDFNGSAPYSFSYSDGSIVSYVNNTSTNPHYIFVSPSSSRSYTLVGFNDRNCAGNTFGKASVVVTTSGVTSITGSSVHYPFNNSPVDIGPNNYNAIPLGSFQYVNDKNNTASSAISFNGAGNTYAQLPQGVYQGGPLSISTYFKINSFTEFGRIVDFGDSWYDWPDNKDNFILGVGQNLEELSIILRTNYSNSFNTIVGIGNALETNKWYHLTFSLSYNEIKICIDGEIIYSKSDLNITFPGINTPINYLAKSNRSIIDNNNNIAYDELKIYNYSLSTSEFEQECGFNNYALTASYPFCGNANDESGNSLNGSITGAQLTTDRFNNPNAAYLFNGSTTSISLGNNSKLKMTEAITISVWINPYVITAPGLRNIISDHAPGEAVDGPGKVFRFAGNELQFIVNGIYAFGNAHYAKYNFSESDKNKWHHLVGTYDKTTIKLYINGVLVNSKAHSTSMTVNNNPILIGKSGYNEFFNGKIDDLRIYDRAISDAEVTQLFNEVNSSCTISGPIAAYSFCNNANDVSGNNYNGSILGTTIYSKDRSNNPLSSISFSGSNYIIIPNSRNWDLSNGHSFSVWIKAPPTKSNFIPSGIISNWQTGSFPISLDVNHDNKIFYFFNSGGPGKTLVGNMTLTPGVWYHVVATWDKSIMKVFINNVLDATNVFTDNIDPASNDYSIGFRRNLLGSNLANAEIDELKVYSKAITEAEISQLYNEFAYSCLNSGLVSSYPFCSNANDVSGNNNNGTVIGASLTTDRFGNPNSAYSFNGSSRIKIKNSASLNVSEGLTISVWAKQTQTNCSSGCTRSIANYGSIILDKAAYGYSDGGYRLDSRGQANITGKRPRLVLSNSTISSSLSEATADINLNQWQHIVATFDKSIISYYINGAKVTTLTSGLLSLTSNNFDLAIGGPNSDIENNTGFNFYGDLDDIKIYNRPITEPEVLQLYNESASTCTNSGPVASYPFCGNANDVSGNNYNGTIVGATLTADRFGNANSAYYFDGNVNSNGTNQPDRINLGINPELKFTGSQMAISCWINPAGANFTSGRIVLGGRVNDSYTLVLENDRVLWRPILIGQGYSNYSAYELYSTNTLPYNQWYHIVAQYDGLVSKLYINGLLNTSVTTNGANLKSNPLEILIGGEDAVHIGSTNSSSFWGSIDDIKIYNRALSNEEIQSLYTEGNPCCPSFAITGPNTGTIGQSPSPLYYISPLSTPGIVWSVTGGTFTRITNTQIHVTWTTPGIHKISAISTVCGFSSLVNVTVSCGSIGSQAILGSITGCTKDPNNQNYFYEIANKLPMRYNWTVQGATFDKYIDNSIGVTWTSTGTKMIYVSQPECGISLSKSVSVSCCFTPTITITGPSEMCTLTGQDYFVTNSLGDTFAWTVLGGTFTKKDEHIIRVQWNRVGLNTIYVKENSCGAASSLNVNISNTCGTTTIGGDPTYQICNNKTNITYTIFNSNESFVWTVVGGTYNYYNQSIDVTWNTVLPNNKVIAKGLTSGTVYELPVKLNCCPETIQMNRANGRDSLCLGKEDAYFVISNKNLLHKYVWSIVGTAFPVGSTEQNVIVIKSTTAGSNLLYLTETTCKNRSVPKEILFDNFKKCCNAYVQIYYGDPNKNACIGENNINYQLLNPSSTTTYTWSVTGGIINYLDNTNIMVTWTSLGKNLISVSENKCGYSDMVQRDVQCCISPINRVEYISGLSDVCKASTYPYELLDNESQYSWSVSGGNVETKAFNKANITWTSSGIGSIKAALSDPLCPGKLIQLDNIKITESEYPFSLGPDASALCKEVVLSIPGTFKGRKLWSTGDSTFSIKVNTSGTYTVRLVDKCVDARDTIKLEIINKEEKIPNMITPNNDNFNDMFEPEGCFFENAEIRFTVHNRWGTVVYENDNYKFNWDAKDVADGLYYYNFVNKSTNEKKSGWLMIAR